MSSNVSRLETNKKNFEKRCNQNDKNLKFMTLGHLYSYLTNFGYYNLRREYGFGNQEEILFWNSNDNRLVSVYFNEPKHDNVETIYGEYFKEYNTYVYNQNDFKKIKYMCISKDFEEKILGKHIKINDFQINNAFENIKINVL